MLKILSEKNIKFYMSTNPSYVHIEKKKGLETNTYVLLTHQLFLRNLRGGLFPLFQYLLDSLK